MKNFIEVFKSRIHSWNEKSFDQEKEKKIMLNSIAYLDRLNNNSDYGHTNIIILLEEMGELSQRVSKYLRGKKTEEDRLLLIEELADVTIGLEYLKEIAKINNFEVLLARDIKIDRLDLMMKENKLK